MRMVEMVRGRDFNRFYFRLVASRDSKPRMCVPCDKLTPPYQQWANSPRRNTVGTLDALGPQCRQCHNILNIYPFQYPDFVFAPTKRASLREHREERIKYLRWGKEEV